MSTNTPYWRAQTTARRTLAPLALLALVPLATPTLPSQGLHIGPDQPVVPDQPQPDRPLPGRPIRPQPRRIQPLEVQSLHIRAEIVDGIASTTLTQVFKNHSSRILEGTWILPLPRGASADGFTMTMNGEQVKGDVLDANTARQTYLSIVRRRRDPGLLEYMGKGCLRARVFPIQPRAEMKVQVRYRHRLPQSGGVYHWWFPLRSAQSQGRAPAKISLDVVVRSQNSIKTIYSPLGDVDTVRKSDREARATMELNRQAIPKRDLDLFIGLSEQSFGLSALTHRPDKKKPGFFTLLLAPKLAWDKGKALPKCINFVLDTSGSMKGQKIEQAKKALDFFVQSLRPEDSFNVVPFSSEAEPLFDAPRLANKDNIQAALALSKRLEARGGTNIEKALCTTLKAALPDTEGLVAMTVFLTDGMPTVDTTDPKRLLSMVGTANTHKQRVFVFGVGHDVNTRLLDKIAGNSRGDRDYVREGEDIERKTSALFQKLSHPVMSEVRIDCAGIQAMDVSPKTTPDIFLGSQLMITGRYQGSGHHAITVSGTVQGKAKKYVYEVVFPEQQKDHDFIPVLWAQQRIAVLLDNIRLNGAHRELVQEVKSLGRQYGIVTPYTSHLILEEGEKLRRIATRHDPGRWNLTPGLGGGAPATAAVPVAERLRIAKELARAGEARLDEAKNRLKTIETRTAEVATDAQKNDLGARAQASGRAAVEQSRALFMMQKKGSLAGGKDRGIAGFTVQRVKQKTFYLVGGIWTDGSLEAKHLEQVTKVKAWSQQWFDLLEKHKGLAPYFAFSTRLILVLDGKAIEVTN